MTRTLASRLVEHHCRSNGMSPEQFGATIGVSGGTIRNLINNTFPNPATQKKVADAVGCAPDELFPAELNPRKRLLVQTVAAREVVAA